MKLSKNEFRTLRKASEGIIRVTEQMNDLVYNIAYEISNLGKPFDSVIIAGETLRIAKIHVPSNGTDYDYLLLKDGQNGICLFDIKREKLGSEYLTDLGYLADPHTYCLPTREQKIWFLQHVAEILTAFTSLWQQQERETTDLLKHVKSAFDKLYEDSEK